MYTPVKTPCGLLRAPRIMCTLTPAQIMEQPDLIRRMCAAGMAAVRINTAHLDGVDQLSLIARRIKDIAPALQVLIDTKGPEMRTTAVAGDTPLELLPGMEVEVAGTDAGEPTTAAVIHVNHPGIADEVGPGDVMLVDDGLMALQVTGVEGGAVRAVVRRGGTLGSRKGVSVRGVDLSLPAVSARDAMYIAYAATAPCVDVIAHSFVRSAADVLAVREAMHGHAKPLVAKIENRQGLENLPGILAEADGVLIARGDLTASLGAEAVPAAQRAIAAEARAVGRPLYLATGILPSLMVSDSVSEADAGGIAAAVAQGVDVMLLTNETAAGPRPLQSVAELARVLGRQG